MAGKTERLPETWKCLKIGEVAKLKSGGTPSKARSDYWHGDVPWFTAKDLKHLRLSASEDRLTPVGVKAGSQLAREDTVLILVRGMTLFRDVPVGILTCDAAFNQDIKGLVAGKSIHPEYLAYCLLASKSTLMSLVDQSGHGTGKLSTELLKRATIPVPPLPEQRAIAAVLSTWDRAIEQTSRLIEAKKKLKQGLMQQLLTGKRRFAEFEGQQWRTTALGQVFKERTEAGREDLPLLAVTANHGVIDRDDLVKRDTSSSDKSKYKRVVPGDIAYNTMRMWQGRSALSDKDGIVSPAYTVCIPQDGVDGRFAEHLFQLPKVVHTFWRHSQGLVDDTLNLKYPRFAHIKLEFPCEYEQRRIAEVLDAMTSEISLLERRLRAVRRQKKGLMQKLLTGRVRVNV